MCNPTRPIALSVLVGCLLFVGLLGAGCASPEMFMPSPEELEKMQKAMDAKNNPPPPPPVADTVGCDLAKSGITSVFPGALIREYQPAGKDSCGYAIDGPRSEQGTDVIAGLRAPFSTWTEDPAARLDSPTGTSFAFGNGSRLCSVKTTWDGKGAAASTYFKIEAVCAPAAGSGPAPATPSSAGSDPAVIPPPAPIPAPATP